MAQEKVLDQKACHSRVEKKELVRRWPYLKLMEAWKVHCSFWKRHLVIRPKLKLLVVTTGEQRTSLSPPPPPPFAVSFAPDLHSHSAFTCCLHVALEAM